MNKVYIFTFDRDNITNYALLQEKIKADKDIISWSHYLMTSYILVSNLSAYQLTTKFRNFMPNHRFMILEVNKNNYSGWMLKDTWDWMRTNFK